MRRLLVVGVLASLAMAHCGSDETAKRADGGSSGGDGSGSRPGSGSSTGNGGQTANGGNAGKSSSSGATAGVSNNGGNGGNLTGGGGNQTSNGGSGPVGTGGNGSYSDAFDPNDHPPQIGEKGCGFEFAAFCDTFGGPSTIGGRSRELDSIFWSAGRMWGVASSTRAMPIGMAQIPNCREGLPNEVWTQQDTLICKPTTDVNSGHLLVGVSAQFYGQYGYRIRQPFDFAGRTGKIAFDAMATPMSPLWGWVSLGITEDPIAMPGYSIQGNDEGSIIPKNAVEIHLSDAPSNSKGVTVRHVHVFKDYDDTVYSPPATDSATYKPGKLNHFEVQISESNVTVTISPYSEDGVTFAGPSFTFKVNTPIPFSRGWVQLSVHNHATLKYTQPGNGQPRVIDATVALFDNVGFDGNVISNWREYEVPDSLVKFEGDPGFQSQQDPYNTANVGYDIGYAVQDQAKGPKQQLKFTGVKKDDVTSAKVAVSFWAEFRNNPPVASYTLLVRLNGKSWHERKLSAKEQAFYAGGPITVDSTGKTVGDPGTQGRLGFAIDVPVEDLVDGDNTVEFVTSGVPTSYPPVVCNIDLVLKTN